MPNQLTHDQIQQNIDAMHAQGATADDIKGYIDSLNIPPSPAQPDSTQGPQVNAGQPTSMLPGVLTPKGSDMVKGIASSEINFGQDLAQGFYLAFGGQHKIDDITKQHLDSAAKLTDLVRANRHPEMNDTWKKMAESEIANAQKVGGSIIGDTRSPEQIVGDALGVATDVLAAGSLPGVGESAVAEKGIVKGAVQGLKTGALAGGAYGAVKGISTGLSENKDVAGVAGEAIKGGAVGAVVGGATGAVVGGTTGGIKSFMTKSEQESNKIQDMISPKPTVKEAKLAMEQGRLVQGKEPTLLKAGTETTVNPTKSQIQAAKTIQEQIPGAAKMNEPQLYTALDKKISETAKNLAPEMEKVKIKVSTVKKLNEDLVTLQKSQLEGKFTRDEIDTTKGMQKDFGERIRKFMKGGNMNDLWDEAKAYDASIPKNVKQATSQSSDLLQAKKDIWLENRAVLRDTLTDTKAGLGEKAQKAFSDMHDMYSSQEGILSKAKIVTKPPQSKAAQFVKSPTGRLIEGVVGGAGLIEGGKKIITGHF